jgi:hypothetical protein
MMTRKARAGSAAAVRSLTPASPSSVLARVGRVVLWLAVGFVLVRGVGAVLDTSATRGPAGVRASAAQVWPDDEARAFAVSFTRAYLSFSPNDPAGYARRLTPFVSDEVAASVVPRFAPGGPTQVVQTASVARVARVDAGRAFVTVAATVASAADVSARYVTVPVARDGAGGLVVYDLPSLAAPPGRATVAAVETESLAPGDEGAIGDVLTRFLRAFLAGRAADLEYFVPAGVHIGALAQRYELVGVDSLAQIGAGSPRARTVLIAVRARDATTGAVYALRYRVRMVRRDRWYVAAVNSPTRER